MRNTNPGSRPRVALGALLFAVLTPNLCAALPPERAPGPVRPPIRLPPPETCPCGGQQVASVAPERELFIHDASVIKDPQRTAGLGAWSFGHLMTEMAPPGTDPGDFVQRWLESWLTDQTINTFRVAGRPSVKNVILQPWPKRPNGKLDLSKAPFSLLGIFNRMDLRAPVDPQGKANGAGESHLVYRFNGNGGPFLVILEYQLPARDLADVHRWACEWHSLGALSFGPAYNAALERLTDQFVRRGAFPGRVNGSAIDQVRTNEIALSSPWELREFHLQAGGLVPAPVAMTPDVSFDNTAVLLNFIRQNAAAIRNGTYKVPGTFAGKAFQGGSAPVVNNNTSFKWTAPGLTAADQVPRGDFGLMTCNGCHAGEPAQQTPFVQTDPPSPFLLGDIPHREADLKKLIQCRPRAAAITAEREFTVERFLRLQRSH